MRDRRSFLKTMGAAALATGMPRTTPMGAAANVRFGVDMYSLAAQNWTPFQMLDWAASMKVNLVHFSEIRFLGSPDWQVALAPDNLRKVRARADELHIDLEIGMRSICPTSSDFNRRSAPWTSRSAGCWPPPHWSSRRSCAACSARRRIGARGSSRTSPRRCAC